MSSHPKQQDIAIRPAINPPVQVKALDDDITASGRKRKPSTTKRRKVNHACLYCRRSHMTCDEGRPCQRWSALKFFRFSLTHESCSSTSIKREIAHLCHDEQKPSVATKEKASSASDSTTTSTPTPTPESDPQAQLKPILSAPEQSINAFPCEWPVSSYMRRAFIRLCSNHCPVCIDDCSCPCHDMAVYGDASGSFSLPT